jgi:hypothetical protein
MRNQSLAAKTVIVFVLALLTSAGAIVSPLAYADEGGASFWLPGQYGSLAAIPSEPGWSIPLIYYHASEDASGSRSFAIGGKITAGVDVRQDLLLAVPTYVFPDTFFGGQLALSIAGVYGRVKVDAEAILTGPGGGILSGSKSDSQSGYGDLYPSASLRWNDGVHNTMVYTMLGVPVGSYEVGRLANIGVNHWSVDAGGGYTYLKTESGREFSAVAGLTYNFKNPDTDYQNGIDLHLDWAASQFLSEQTHLGLVGYFYYQITGDSGSGAILGDFKSRVNGIGPQVGYTVKIGGREAYLNLKGYWEFGGKHMPDGWNVWLTLVLPIDG